MRNVLCVLFIGCVLAGCGRSEEQPNTATRPSTSAGADAATATTPEARNCQSVVAAAQLGKTNVYQESAKPISLTLTVEQDTSTTRTSADCYFNNAVTVLAARKSGKQLFRRTLSKDDLLYFISTDEAVERAVLQTVTYKPTFNGRPYVTLTFRLVEPGTQKSMDYTVFMNYVGEIIKVR